ncbi:CBS domain-containing protein [Streptomyces sp. TRM 70361]|uniref:CBS domain-containing protein n=1 Tax=Streptomyces sp. TRM 70361 TaxID=3116553 RepID=UPI002E7B7F29|nr:CBS domain-containing protein [Streptomyces sp. TRM 70361]MEE1938400.1 CBS domain-containing protein [Streptomyces sp. TRM 70361]
MTKPPTDTRAAEAARTGDGGEPRARLTVDSLPAALSGVVSVTPNATYEQAITIMAINGYSQLPVLSGRSQYGAVTWRSIARARHARPEAPFSDAITQAQEVSCGDDLIDVLPKLVESDFVLVRNRRQEISGILTVSDLAMAYGSLAGPFLLIGELDQRLRRIITRHFDLADVTSLCDPEGSRKVVSFHDLSMGDYQRVLEKQELWDRLGWPLDRKVFVKHLDEIRRVRNDVMHFNPDPLPADAVQKVRNMIVLLREYGG